MGWSSFEFVLHSRFGSADQVMAELDMPQLKSLFDLTAFWAQDRSISDLITAILNSEPVVSVRWDDRLIGFARAISDGVYRATILDVMVHPDYQGQGIGRKLVETLLSHPNMNRVERVYLTTTNQQRFYERIGFEANLTTTMVLFQTPIEVPVVDGLDREVLELGEILRTIDRS
jgi:N-acetylglutamate synthase-like GNAT family acetyltransferase